MTRLNPLFYFLSTTLNMIDNKSLKAPDCALIRQLGAFSRLETTGLNRLYY